MRKLFLSALFFIPGLQKSNAQTVDSLKYKYINLTIVRYGSGYIKGNERISFHDLSFKAPILP